LRESLRLSIYRKTNILIKLRVLKKTQTYALPSTFVSKGRRSRSHIIEIQLVGFSSFLSFYTVRQIRGYVETRGYIETSTHGQTPLKQYLLC